MSAPADVCVLKAVAAAEAAAATEKPTSKPRNKSCMCPENFFVRPMKTLENRQLSVGELSCVRKAMKIV